MPVEVLNGIYQIEVCLPNNPLKALNSYFIKGEDRNLIIDTGFNRDECKADMNNALRDLKVSLDDTDFFITHHHADHSGLISYLAAESSRVFCSKESASSISSGRAGSIWHEMRNYALLSGFPEEELAEVMKTNPAYKYCNEGGRPLTVIEDGETLAVGPYRFICIHTPGHTSGHFCLYEPREKILFSGDHILADITPNITSWSDKYNSLKQYLNSLDTVAKLDIKITLPGHRRIIHNCYERVNELKSHHKGRLQEILHILDKGSKTPYQVASEMKWDLSYPAWADFPALQKWFATGEANAHIQNLVEDNLLVRNWHDHVMHYSVSK